LGGELAPNPPQRVAEQVELVVATDQRRSRGLGDVYAQARPRRQCSPDRHRLGLTFGGDRVGLLVPDCPGSRPLGGLVDQHPVDRGGRLQPGRGIHNISRGHPLPLDRSRVQGDEGLPGGHSDPDMQVKSRVGLVELSDRGADSQGRTHRPLGIVLVRCGGAKQRHDGIADELLHRSPEPLQIAS
jgi:hypothetical protein